jgi:hypothetical protein
MRLTMPSAKPLEILALMLLLGSLVARWWVVAVFAIVVVVLARGMQRYGRGHGRVWILYLHSFRDREIAREFTNTIDPLLCCFGTPIHGVHESEVDSITKLANLILLRKPSTAGHLPLTEADWRAGIISAFSEIRVAVVDLWHAGYSVQWELHEATERLSLSQVVVLLPPDGEPDESLPAGVTQVRRTTGDFVVDFACALQRSIGPVPYFRVLALDEFLRKRRASATFRGLLICNMFVQWFRQGLVSFRLRPSEKKHRSVSDAERT